MENVSYNCLLKKELPEESMLVRYADDVATFIAARNVELETIISVLFSASKRLCLHKEKDPYARDFPHASRSRSGRDKASC